MLIIINKSRIFDLSTIVVGTDIQERRSYEYDSIKSIKLLFIKKYKRKHKIV